MYSSCSAPISSWSFGCSPVRSVVRVDGDKCAAAFSELLN